jgi:hypothetical protein
VSWRSELTSLVRTPANASRSRVAADAGVRHRVGELDDVGRRHPRGPERGGRHLDALEGCWPWSRGGQVDPDGFGVLGCCELAPGGDAGALTGLDGHAW